MPVYYSRVIAVLLSVCCFFLAAAATAGLLQPKTVADAFGVQIKPDKIQAADLQALQASGITSVRIPVWWWQVEQEEKKYAWDKTVFGGAYKSYDALVAALRAHHLRVLFTLRMGNPLYTGLRRDYEIDGRVQREIPPPTTDEQRAAFAAFAAATAQHFTRRYGSDALAFIIWNEPNLPGFWPPQPDAKIFGRLLAETCRHIKQTVPFATVIGPGLAYKQHDVDWVFLETMAAQGGLACLDALTLHPYGYDGAAKAAASLEKVRAWALQKGYSALKIAVDELGYAVRQVTLADRLARRVPMTEAEQAALLLDTVQQQVAHKIPLTIWYEYQDSGTDLFEPEHGFGLRRADGTLKPSWQVLQRFLATEGARLFPE